MLFELIKINQFSQFSDLSVWSNDAPAVSKSKGVHYVCSAADILNVQLHRIVSTFIIKNIFKDMTNTFLFWQTTPMIHLWFIILIVFGDKQWLLFEWMFQTKLFIRKCERYWHTLYRDTYIRIYIGPAWISYKYIQRQKNMKLICTGTRITNARTYTIRAPSLWRTSSSRLSTSSMICRSRSDKLSSICVVVTAIFGVNVSIASESIVFVSPTYPVVLLMLTSTRCRTLEFWICVGVGGRRALRPLANFLQEVPKEKEKNNKILWKIWKSEAVIWRWERKRDDERGGLKNIIYSLDRMSDYVKREMYGIYMGMMCGSSAGCANGKSELFLVSAESVCVLKRAHENTSEIIKST